jgi:hypothetical protein
MPDKRADAKQSPAEKYGPTWAAAEERFRASEAAKEYLQSTGKYTKSELEQMKLDELRSELRDEAERQLQANSSRVSPETIKLWIDAGGRFDDRVQAQEFLVGTGRFGATEVQRMTDADLRAAVDNYANNALFGNDSAVKNEYVQLWADAERRFRAANPGATSTSPTGTRTTRTDSGGGGGDTGTNGAGDDDPGATIPAGPHDDDSDDSGTSPQGATTSPATPSDTSGGGGNTETQEKDDGEQSSVPDTWVPSGETVVTDPETGETVADVQWYTDSETGKTYGVTSDGRVIDENGNPVDTGTVDDEDDDAGFQPIDAPNVHVGRVDLGGIVGHESGGGDVDPVDDAAGNPLADFDGHVLTKDDLLGPGGGDPGSPDDVLGDGSRPLPVLSKFDSTVTDPHEEDAGAPLGAPDDAPGLAPSVAASMLEDRGSFALGGFESPAPSAPAAELDDPALDDDGTVAGED